MTNDPARRAAQEIEAEVAELVKGYTAFYGHAGDFAAIIRKHFHAEPSAAPADVRAAHDERAEFEDWVLLNHGGAVRLDRNPRGEYIYSPAYWGFAAWRHRADLAAQRTQQSAPAASPAGWVLVEVVNLKQIAADMDLLLDYHAKSDDCTYQIAHFAAVTRDLAKKMLATLPAAPTPPAETLTASEAAELANLARKAREEQGRYENSKSGHDYDQRKAWRDFAFSNLVKFFTKERIDRLAPTREGK